MTDAVSEKTFIDSHTRRSGATGACSTTGGGSLDIGVCIKPKDDFSRDTFGRDTFSPFVNFVYTRVDTLNTDNYMN